MGIGPVFGIPRLLKRHGLKIEDIDMWELNEAFAVQVIYCRDKLGIDPEKLNVNGGSIAVGHPYGMTGSRLVGHVLIEGRRRKAKYGRRDHVCWWRHGCGRPVRNPSINFTWRGAIGTISLPSHSHKENPMDLNFSKEELAFRDEVRTFFKENVPPEVRQKIIEGRHVSKDELVNWQRTLNKKGWAVPHWPKQYGGTGWTPVQQYIFLEELQAAPAPSPLPFGVNMVAPVIYTFGNEEQKKYYLPRIANLDDWWCQGFSEPGSGSDLASLKMTAKRKGDVYILNGQKTWTTLAQYADWIFCLCRTDPEAKKQTGISFILADMKTRGITVRPIQTIDGGHEINEVFFDDVEVPVSNLVGEENKGWDYAKFLLGNERTNIARVGMSKERIRRIKDPGIQSAIRRQTFD